MQFESSLAVISCLILIAIVIFHFYKSKETNSYYIFIMLIIAQLWFSTFLGFSAGVIQFYTYVFSSVLFGPIFYLFIKKELNRRLSKRIQILNLIVPVLLVLIQLYNVYLNSDEDLQITIVINALSSLINLIYAVICLGFLGKLDRLKGGFYKVVFIVFCFSLMVYLIIASIVSIFSALYFTDDLELVQLSVNVPKLFETSFEIWLLIVITASAVAFGLIQLKPNNEK